MLDVDGRTVDYSTYLGGSDSDRGFGIFASGDVTIAVGNTISIDFPTTSGVYDQTLTGEPLTDLLSHSAKGIPLPAVLWFRKILLVSSASAGEECNDCVGCSVNSTRVLLAGRSTPAPAVTITL